MTRLKDYHYYRDMTRRRRRQTCRINTAVIFAEDESPLDRLKTAILVQMIEDARLWAKVSKRQLSHEEATAFRRNLGVPVEWLADGTKLPVVREVVDYYDSAIAPKIILRLSKDTSAAGVKTKREPSSGCEARVSI